MKLSTLSSCLATTFALLVISACDTADSGPVFLRVENASALDFSSVAVGFTRDDANFGAVGAGQTSDYHAFETAYRYGGVTAEAGGETYEIIPVDFVGEDPLAAGLYTFVLTVEGSTLELTLEED
ncbi:MAG: hypothetical protein AAF845_09690 [Bacteroidota bacterium]